MEKTRSKPRRSSRSMVSTFGKRQELSEEHDVGPERRPAVGTPRKRSEIGVIFDTRFVSAGGAEDLMNVTVNVDEVRRAGLPVKAVDVLGQHPDALEASLGFRQNRVGPVERRTPGRGLDLVDVLPGESGVPAHHRARERLLDRNTLGRVGLFVEAADSPVGGKPRIRGDAGAGDEENARRSPEERGHGLEPFLVHASRVSILTLAR